MINESNINEFIDFGGLIVFEVRTFNPLLFKIETNCRTFNKSHAEKIHNQNQEKGLISDIFSYWVHFDNE